MKQSKRKIGKPVLKANCNHKEFMIANLYNPPAGQLFSNDESYIGGNCYTARLHLDNGF